jgi:hypothetical protein
MHLVFVISANLTTPNLLGRPEVSPAPLSLLSTLLESFLATSKIQIYKRLEEEIQFRGLTYIAGEGKHMHLFINLPRTWRSNAFIW